jgi:hypothetical protein
VRAFASWLGVAALMAAGAMVFWGFDALSCQDLPGHAGFIELRHRFAEWPSVQPYYVLAPELGPYSLFRALGEALVVPLGPVFAVRAIATLPLLATPLALVWSRWRLHGDPSATAAYFGIALSFGFMTLLGLASYLLGVAVMLVGLTLWLELLVAVDSGDARARRLEVSVACFAPFLLVTHGGAFVVFVGLACASAVATGRRWRRLSRVRALVPAMALAGWAAWRERASALPAGSVEAGNPPLAAHFQGPLDKLSLLLTPTLMTRTGLDALVGVGLWVLLGLGVLATARGLGRPADARELASRSHARALLVCLGFLGALFLALPHAIGWLAFVDGRVVPLLLLVAVMTVRTDALGPRLSWALRRAAPAAAGAMVGIVLVASHAFQAEAAGWREVFAEIPAGSRLLNLPLDPNSDVFTAHPFIHYDKLVLTERPVVVSDAWFHQGTGLYPTGANPSVRLPASYVPSDLRGVDWPAYRLEDWDYVLIRTRPGAGEPEVPVSLTRIAHQGGWWLFDQAPPVSITP